LGRLLIQDLKWPSVYLSFFPSLSVFLKATYFSVFWRFLNFLPGSLFASWHYQHLCQQPFQVFCVAVMIFCSLLQNSYDASDNKLISNNLHYYIYGLAQCKQVTINMYENDMLKVIFNQFVERNNQNRL
jgi:hypothetical protein